MWPPYALALGPLIEAAEEAAEMTAAQGFVVAAFLLAVGASMIPLFRKSSASLLEPTPGRAAVFRPLDLALVAVVFILGQALVAESYRIWIGADELDLEALGVIPLLGLSAGSQGLTVALLLGLALRRPGGAATVGLRNVTPGERGIFAVVWYLLSIPSLMGLGALTAAIFMAQGGEPPVQDTAVLVAEGLPEDPVLILALVALVIPLFEEIIFRGFLLELLVSRLGVPAGIFLSSALFAILHGGAVFLPIFGLAVLLAGVKLRTRSLGASWTIHAVHNGLTTLLITGGALPG
jgi:membrane protease YdiL (CAAX protease family)